MAYRLALLVPGRCLAGPHPPERRTSADLGRRPRLPRRGARGTEGRDGPRDTTGWAVRQGSTPAGVQPRPEGAMTRGRRRLATFLAALPRVRRWVVAVTCGLLLVTGLSFRFLVFPDS